MSYFEDLEFPKFKWEDLAGKNLHICVGKGTTDGVETTVVMGVDLESGMHYFIHEDKRRIEK